MSIIKQKVTLIGKNKYNVTALIDSGTETSFIVESLALKLGCQLNQKVSAYLADGTKTEGYLTSSIIRIKDYDFGIKLIATKNLGEDKLIIGVDFMQDKNYILVMKNDKLNVKKPKYDYKGYRL